MTVGFVRALAAADDIVRHAGSTGEQIIVHLLGSPFVTHGDLHFLPSEGGSRLLAYLALNSGAHDRSHVASRLWPDADDARAAGNLRSTLWRLGALGVDVVRADKCSVRLSEPVLVDIRLLGDWAVRIISGTATHDDLVRAPWDLYDLEIMPGWFDDWIVYERERLRQRMLHALEGMCAELIAARRLAEAVDVCLVAIRAEPLRESAHRLLAAAHLAEGNWNEARRRYAAYRLLVREELGIDPSPEFAALVGFGREPQRWGDAAVTTRR